MGLSVVILAAGNGKRMCSMTPKVMHTLAGLPMLEHVVRKAQLLEPDAIHVVYGSGGTEVRDRLDYLPVNWVKQEMRLGTGHAVMQALPYCHEDDQILVLYGDVPLISEKTLNQLLDDTAHNALGLVIADQQDPSGFGRIIRNEMGNIVAIVEDKDATDIQKVIQEINTGIITVSAKHLKTWLPQLKNSNKQGEYYLTDIVACAVKDGIAVGGVMAHTSEEMQGVNDRWQLAKLERYHQLCVAQQLSYRGIKIMDPQRLDIRGNVHIGRDTTLDINVILEGKVEIGQGCYIGPNVIIRDSTIGDGVSIEANSIVEGAVLYNKSIVGPFARIRPKTTLATGAKVGTFVEVNRSTIGEGSKANHLAYIGDAVLGKGVNIGAGTITCNYDGAQKWTTEIGDDVFIGSNTSLIAPITIGDKATVGAGSTLSKKVLPEHLALERSEQRSIKNWHRPQKSNAHK